MNITFIGGGNIATALIGGLLEKGFDPGQIKVVEPQHEARTRLTQQGVACFPAAAQAVPFGDVVVLAVKPQQVRGVAAELARHLHDELVVSIAAGIRLTDLARWLGGSRPLVRCMPNTPALIGQGIAALYAEPRVSNEQRSAAQSILAAVGRTVWLDDEALLDPVTAVSGSGPAYVFYFMEALEKAARELGLPPQVARDLVVETFRGAAELARRSPEQLAILRERVTSKGGTTERALTSFSDDAVGEAIGRAVRAAHERGRELGAQLGRD
jgi:pyrroline-5-carboxylate reductase